MPVLKAIKKYWLTNTVCRNGARRSANAHANPIQYGASGVSSHSMMYCDAKGPTKPSRSAASLGAPLRAAPAMGADTDALLTEAGFTAAQIQFLRERAVI